MKKGSRSLSFRICALVIALWLTLLGLLTWAVAQDFQNQIYSDARELQWTQHNHQGGLDEAIPGHGSLMQIQYLGYPYYFLRTKTLLPVVLDQTPKNYSSKDWFWDEWELLYGFQAVTVFYDEAGEPMIKSGNLLTMNYITEENWDGKNREHQGAAYIDLDKLPGDVQLGALDLRFSSPWVNPPAGLSDWALRARGYFSGDEFIPVSLDMALLGEYSTRDWENLLTLETPPDVELETIYAWETGGSTFYPKAVSIDGKEYASLVDFAVESEMQYSSGNLIQSMLTLSSRAPGNTGAERYQLTVLFWPLQYAMLRLIPMYLGSGLAVGLCLWLLLRGIRKNLTLPLESLRWDMERGRSVTPSSQWQDIHQTEAYLQQSQSRIRALQNEVQQLNASLDYARHAEENRRQLVSNITHELKTPLAVIHSYAEGLQAGIAGEKRAYYLSAILEETEKMDAMVLEMLDFSRLEAGKVHLNMDHFSLFDLTKEILNKLSPEESRTQSIHFGLFCNECMMTADEGRISQVVTNLISNALKYTPADGKIVLQVFSNAGSANFKITNHADHLPEDVLDKIFDSFYRVDAARSDKGTGLGLPIARSIIQLHRGRLTARNVWDEGKPCLEFAFEIPLQ